MVLRMPILIMPARPIPLCINHYTPSHPDLLPNVPIRLKHIPRRDRIEHIRDRIEFLLMANLLRTPPIVVEHTPLAFLPVDWLSVDVVSARRVEHRVSVAMRVGVRAATEGDDDGAGVGVGCGAEVMRLSRADDLCAAALGARCNEDWLDVGRTTASDEGGLYAVQSLSACALGLPR